MKMTDLLTTR